MSCLGRVGRCDYSSSLRGVGYGGSYVAVRRYAIGLRKEHGAQQGERPMARELEGKVAVVTGAASGIGLASTEAMLAAGSRVVMVDCDEAALKALCNKHGDAVIPPSGHRPARPEG